MQGAQVLGVVQREDTGRALAYVNGLYQLRRLCWMRPVKFHQLWCTVLQHLVPKNDVSISKARAASWRLVWPKEWLSR